MCTKIQNALLEVKATLLLSQGQVEAANEVYSLVPRADRSTKMFSPFAEDFRDCVFCPVTDTTAYTKAELIEKLVEYDYRARADIDNGPDYFYLLGTAWYNMSYFGSAWEATDYFRSGSNWYYSFNDVYPCSQSPFGNRENHNLTKAKMYFSKALELAKETGAKIEIVNDPVEAVRNASAVYTDVWVSMGDSNGDVKTQFLKPYQLNEELLKFAEPDAVVMHCLPAKKGNEITEEVFEKNAEIIFNQAENRLWAQMALMEKLFS